MPCSFSSLFLFSFFLEWSWLHTLLACWSACTPSCDHHWGSGSPGTLLLVFCSLWHSAQCLCSWKNLCCFHIGQHLCPLHWGPCAPRTCSCFCIGSSPLWSLSSLLPSQLSRSSWGSLLDPPFTFLLGKFWLSCQAWCFVPLTWLHVSYLPPLEGIGPPIS